jgi:hypothetical protein
MIIITQVKSTTYVLCCKETIAGSTEQIFFEITCLSS